MKYSSLTLLFFVAFASAGPAWSISFEESRHLLSRTGFGGSAKEIRSLGRLDWSAAVRQLLDNTRKTPVTSPPSWVHNYEFRPWRFILMSQKQRRQFFMNQRLRGMQLQTWWLREMVMTDSPLTERMTLFWHNHFTTAFRKVRWPRLLYRQNALYRRHALGNFRELLHAVAKDPAMILYLDNQSNKKSAPNENFARELLELFTLGEGHYTEKDIREAARAFTGWRVNRRTGQFRFARRLHDFGRKNFMSRSGHFNGNDIIEIILANPRTAEFIVEKLWREFVSQKLNRHRIKKLARLFRKHDYEIRPLMQALLHTPEFRSHRNYGTLIKSPAELVVGSIRLFRIPIRNPVILSRATRVLGQDLFNPPNVRGWPGGKQWITSATLLIRQQIVRRVARGQEMMGRGGRFQRRMMQRMRRQQTMRMKMQTNRNRNMQAMMQAPPLIPVGKSVAMETPLVMRKVLLPLQPVNRTWHGLSGNALASQLILDPVYQLK